MLKKMFKSYDYSLITVVFLLCVFGLVMVYSSSMVVAVALYDVPSDYFYEKQKLSLIVAIAVFFFTMIIPYRVYAHPNVIKTIVFGSLGMLIIVFLFGRTAGNAQSWLNLGRIGFQPSEFIKLGVIIYLAGVYAKKQTYIDQFDKAVLPPIVFTVIICLFIIIQPDFGTAFIIALIAATIVVCSGMGLKSLVKLALLGIATLVIILPIYFAFGGLSNEQLSRFQGYSQPFAYEDSYGFQLVNSYIAIGSGGIKGLGLGNSIQKYGYLPEAHTDFIMAIVAEELGVFGVVFVLLSLAFIVIKGFLIARESDDPFGSLLTIGISSMIGIQTFINIGGLTGLLPITGVPLPFISFGGSSLVLLMASMGVLVNVSMFVNYRKAQNKKGQKFTASNSAEQRTTFQL